jgi:hypothetical protein
MQSAFVIPAAEAAAGNARKATVKMAAKAKKIPLDLIDPPAAL